MWYLIFLKLHFWKDLTFSLLSSLICHWPTYPSSSLCLDWSSAVSVSEWHVFVPLWCLWLVCVCLDHPWVIRFLVFLLTWAVSCFPPLCCPLLPLYCPFLISPKLWLPVRAFVLVHVCPSVAWCVSSYEIYDAHLVFHGLSSKPLYFFFIFFYQKCVYTEQLTITVPALLAAGWFKAYAVLKIIIDLGLKIYYL